jgi:glycosyltransferase involved in cell wall biosynthesis
MEKVGPKVSVVIPCFRSGRFVRRAVDSVLHQSFSDWELVLIDNASDDDTWAIAQEFAGRDERIRIFRNRTNVGPVRNWRRGVRVARGEYACLLFSDDWYEPEFLVEAQSLIENAPSIGFVYSSVEILRAGKEDIRLGHRPSYQLDKGGPHPSIQFLKGTFEEYGNALPVSPGCAIFRRKDLERWLSYAFADAEAKRFLSHGAGPDVAIFVQACVMYPNFGHIAKARVNFLAHASNLSWGGGIAESYAIALRELYAALPVHVKLNDSRVRAVSYLRLRSTPLAREAFGSLTLLAMLYVAALAVPRVLGRLARGLRFKEQ